MNGRITPAILSGSVLDGLNSAMSALERSSSELSSGKKILEPSDNPYGASEAIDLQSQLDGLQSYTTGAQEGIAWENTSSSAMSNMSSLLQSVREILVRAPNGTYNASDLQHMAAEVQQLTEAVKQDANTQYAGQYVFSGTDTTTAPYEPGAEDAYKGDAGTIARAIGPGLSVVVNTNLSSLLGSGQGAADGKLLDTLRTISEHLKGGTPADVEALGSSDMEGLEASIETLTSLQARAGSVTNQLQTAINRIEGLQGTIAAGLSGVQDVNIAEVSIAYSNEQAAYEAALRAGASIVQESLLQFLH